MKRIALYLWQLPQNILGLLFLLFIKGEGRHTLNGISFYYCWGFSGGISLGKYIILGDYCTKSVKHEYGHCIQSKMLGPLYLLVVGLPSLILAMVCRDDARYFRLYPERWADVLGGIKRM